MEGLFFGLFSIRHLPGGNRPAHPTRVGRSLPFAVVLTGAAPASRMSADPSSALRGTVPHADTRAGAAQDFLGRYEEVALLSQTLNKAMAGESRFVLVEGAAGIGKTALLRRFVAAFVADRAVVHLLHASGDQSEVSLAYGVIEQLALSARTPIPEEVSSLNTRVERPLEPRVVGSGLLNLVRGCLASRPPQAEVLWSPGRRRRGGHDPMDV